MENLLWVIVSVLLLMCLTSLKAIWRLRFRVDALEKEVQILKSAPSLKV